MSGEPVIIEAAINGATPKERNPNSPRLPDEIAADALACLDAGAAIVHNHVDVVGVPGDEAAARYLEGWQPVFEQRPDALLYPTTNFGPGVEGAYSHMAPLTDKGNLRIGIIDPGSVNLGGCDEAWGVYSHDERGALAAGVLVRGECKKAGGEVSLSQPYIATRGALYPLKLRGAAR